MKAKKTLIAVGLATVAFVAVVAAGQDADVIKLKFAKDTVLKYKTDVTTRMDIMGQSMEMGTTTTQTTTVESQKDGWTTLNIKTDEIKSTGEQADMMGANLDSMKGLVIKLDVDESGMTRNFAFANAANMDPMTKQMMEGSLKATQATGYMGVSFPKEGIKVGSKWNTVLDASKLFGTNEMITAVNGKIPADYEVVGFEDVEGKRNVKVKIKLAGTVTMAIASPAGDMNATVKLQSDTTSFIETATGFLSKSEGLMNSDIDFGMGTMTQQVSTKVSRVK